MHGTGIASYKQPGTAGERDQLSNGTWDTFGGAAAGGFHFAKQGFLARTEIDQRLQAILRQTLGEESVTLGGPLLGAPAGARIEDGEVSNVTIMQFAFALLFGDFIARKLDLWDFHSASDDGFCQGKILFDHVRSLRDHLARVEHAGSIFARLGYSVNGVSARPAGDQGGAHGTLKVGSDAVTTSAQLAQSRCNLFPRVIGRERRAPPGGIHGMDSVYQRALRGARAKTRRAHSAEQFCPTF